MCCGDIEFRTSLSAVRQNVSEKFSSVSARGHVQMCKGNYARIITLRGSWIGAVTVVIIVPTSSVLPTSDRKCFNWFLACAG